MYSILNNKIKTPKAQTKYADKGLIFDHHTWRKHYPIGLPFKCVKDHINMVSIQTAPQNSWYQYISTYDKLC